jgi:hypothetical protein
MIDLKAIRARLEAASPTDGTAPLTFAEAVSLLIIADAATELVAKMRGCDGDNGDGNDVNYECDGAATHNFCGLHLCDEHKAPDSVEMRHAPALRRLMAAMGTKP